MDGHDGDGSRKIVKRDSWEDAGRRKKIKTMHDLLAIAQKFRASEDISNILEFGDGNINDTYRVTLKAKKHTYFILQRINTQVFVEPELVMRNMRTVTEHVRVQQTSALQKKGRRWEMPRVLLTQNDQDHWIGPDGSFWRAMSFIENARTFNTINNMTQAKEVGYALGMFHTLLSNLPPDKLADTLKGFHQTTGYLRHYDTVLAKQPIIKSSETNYCRQFIRKRADWAHVLENAKASGKLHLRIIHGDPKVNNIMMDTNTGQAISIIDLDTVKPGLVHYDIGDCLRSACNIRGEESKTWETTHFETDICQAIFNGYHSVASKFLTVNDYDHLYEAARLIAFELGLRYFTDYLEGNVYFKAKSPEHNLNRALIQFKLTESIERQASTIHAIIRDLR